jgi:hypothetical protein
MASDDPPDDRADVSPGDNEATPARGREEEAMTSAASASQASTSGTTAQP